MGFQSSREHMGAEEEMQDDVCGAPAGGRRRRFVGSVVGLGASTSQRVSWAVRKGRAWELGLVLRRRIGGVAIGWEREPTFA